MATYLREHCALSQICRKVLVGCNYVHHHWRALREGDISDIHVQSIHITNVDQIDNWSFLNVWVRCESRGFVSAPAE